MRNLCVTQKKSWLRHVINSEEGNAKTALEMSTLRENVLRTTGRLYEKSKLEAALHNAVDDRDGAAIPVKSSKAGEILTRQLNLQKP